MIGKVLDHRYRVIRVLATGGFGQTYIAEDTRRPGNPVCVVKHLMPSHSDPKMYDTAKRLFQSEAETLERLGNHDQIPRLLAYFDENQEFYLVQEFIEGRTLNDELIPGYRWTQSQVIQMLHELLTVLNFVHDQGVIHRDIKPDNIIRRAGDNKFVLVDFGAVKQLRSPNLTALKNQTATVAIGTPGYMATEQAQGKPRPSSDIYSLGVIAIQAVTGVAASDIREDPSNGELMWQHLAPVTPRLAAVLNKMVRYHFKDRYQSAAEVLQALQTMSPVSVSAGASQQYQPKAASKINQTATPSRMATIAVAPKNPVVAKPVRQDSSKPDPLPLLIGVALAGGAAFLATNVVASFRNYNFNIFEFASRNATAKTCVAKVTRNSNIRSEPTSLYTDNIVQKVNKNSSFVVSGKRTRRGWVELQLATGKSAWVHEDVIANNGEWVSCLRDRGTAIKVVDDSGLIAVRTTANKPKPQAKPEQKPEPKTFPILDIFKQSPEKTTKPLPKQEENITPEKPTEKPTENTSEDSNKIVAEAQKKYESGDLQGAISLLETIGKNASSGIEQTTEIASQWQKDWEKAESLFNEVNKAVENGQWDKVMDYKNNPDKMPNIQYWRDKIDPLLQQAAKNLETQITKPETTTQKTTPKQQAPNNRE